MSRESEEDFDQKVDALRMRIKDLDQLKVRDNVFDDITLLALYKLVTRRWISTVGGSISTGKEANVFLGERGDDLIAIKIYLMRSANFHKMLDYIAGDRRFVNIGKNRKDIIFTWTKKEFSNLKRAEKAGIRVPKPLVFDRNILIMQFLGDGEDAYPQLKDANIENPAETYEEIVSSMEILYKKARLVHGDLSEYNILYGNGHPYLIDVGQAVTPDHPNAMGFLKRDIEQINRFFDPFCQTKKVHEILSQITGQDHRDQSIVT